MINASIFLVTAVHEINISSVLAIATRTPEKPAPHPLTDGPALDTRTKRIDPPDDFMARNPRPSDRKESVHRGRIRVADPTCLHANAYLIGTGVEKRLSYFREFSRSREFDCSVCYVHIASA